MHDLFVLAAFVGMVLTPAVVAMRHGIRKEDWQ